MTPPHLQTYAQRAQKHTNPAAKLLLETMERKQTNLSVSVDVTKAQEFLAIIDAVGPFVCLIKTHIDIIEDFDNSLINRLQELSTQHDFLIFEDRKFADIGNTVALQYSSGVYKIASWAHITNAHAVPGPSIVTGLASIGVPLQRGLILLAEMSSKGALTTGSYVEDAVRMARARRDFVVGFIAQHRMEGIDALERTDVADEDFLVLAPGVGLDSKGDAMGQQYRTPEEVVLNCGCDVIIVGRGIFGKSGEFNAESVQVQAKRYQSAGWDAYKKRVSLP
ncbi:humps family-domain-containing protein [Hygrophoropsis aurantiaca]|uniref:Humps family-domain-containing protein n=1 Tax=Hygrophoropsis aurantiaca TaxID=72124 RepID=A0ACB8ALU3_9AGAM|nr:humps family-domain-containing protein [Hygrophoropsis aurantiaca]